MYARVGSSPISRSKSAVFLRFLRDTALFLLLFSARFPHKILGTFSHSLVVERIEYEFSHSLVVERIEYEAENHNENQ